MNILPKSIARAVLTGLRPAALAAAIPLLASCCAILVPDLGAPSSPDSTATLTAQPLQTDTPTPVGTWEMVLNGKVYDSTTVEPIADAAVRYEVIASYFSEIQEGRPHATVTDAQGHFSLPMIVHDTDNIRIYAEAPGYAPYDAKLDLFGDRFLDIALVKQ